MEQSDRKEGGGDQATYRFQQEIMNMRESTDREGERMLKKKELRQVSISTDKVER